MARTVNTTQVIANWLVGREIVEEEQQGRSRAGYGERLMHDLAARLLNDYGPGYGLANLKLFRQFYLSFPELADAQKGYAVRSQSPPAMLNASPTQAWRPGRLHPSLSWTHYRTLLRVENPAARAFYEIEAVQNNGSARELERQINNLFYERLGLSQDKKGLIRPAREGQGIQGPLDVFKDPLVLEFLKIPAAARLVESDLEAALLNELQSFLLELGKGFGFVARQERLTLDGDHFYIGLVF